MPVNTRLQVRRGTASGWTSTNPTLSAGEIGFETDTKRIKIGDGTTAWTSLDYNVVVPTGFLAGSGLSVDVAADGATVTYSLSDPTINIGDITGFDDAVNDRVNDLLTAGSNIQLTYTDNNDDSSTLEIAVTGVSLTGHTHNLSDITDVTASATEVNYLDGSTPGTVTAGDAVVVDGSKNISGFNSLSAGTISTTGNLIVGGDLTVEGVTTTVNSTTVEIGDNIIRVNTSGLSTGGFEVFDGTNYQQLIWDNVDGRWEFSGSEVQSTGNIEGRTLESTVAGPTAPIVVASTGLVSNLNADLLDGQQGSYYLNASNLSTGTLSSGLLPNVSVGSTSTGPTATFVSSVTTDSKGRVVGVNSTTHTLATDSVKGIASFDNGDFTVSSGAVSIKASGIGNSQLENDSVTIGQTELVLGGTYSAISGTSAANPVVLTYFAIDGGSP